MEPNNITQLLIIAFFTVTFFYSAGALCVPRNQTLLYASVPPAVPPSPSKASAPQAAPPKDSASVPSPREESPPYSPPMTSPTSTPSTDPPSEAGVSTLSTSGLTDSVSASASAVSNSLHSVSGSASSAINSLHSVSGSPTGNSANSDPAATTSNPAVQKICASTDYPSLCLSALNPFLTGRIDPASMLESAMKAITEQTKLATATVAKLAAAPTSSSLASKLNDCKDIYDDALSNIESAVEALSARDIGTINSMLSAALSDYSTCDDGFGGGGNPLADLDDKLMKMASNCLAIASLIKW